MADFSVVLNRPAIGVLLKSAEVQADLSRRAHRVASAAGPGHEVEIFVGRNRARAIVRTETFAAMRAEAKTRALTRAIEAGR